MPPKEQHTGSGPEAQDKDRDEPKRAMERVQEEAAEERRSERGYQ
jgi:hypothetical protein